MVGRQALPLYAILSVALLTADALAASRVSAATPTDEESSYPNELLRRHHKVKASSLAPAASLGTNQHQSFHLLRWNEQLDREKNGVAPDLVPTVDHRKAPGQGYMGGSPLFKKQQYQFHLPQAIRTLPPPRPIGDADPIVTPVSTSMLCIVNLVSQFMVVYTLVFILQTLNQLKILNREQEQKSLATVADTVFFVPMLCILFLAVRVRAVHLTQGDPEAYDLPQWWVKDSMIGATFSTAALTLCVFLTTVLYGDVSESRSSSSMLCRFMFALRTGCTFVIYLCSTIVCIGICVMPAPTRLWGEGVPAISATVLCTIVLCVTYFGVYLALASARATNEAGMLGPPQRFHPAQELLKGAAMTVAFVPMLCVLFITARLWALELDWKNGEPQGWVQIAFYVCTFSVIFQVVLAVLGATASEQDGSTRAANDQEANLQGQSGKHGSTKMTEALRLFAVICLYLGVLTIVYGIILMKHPHHQGVDGSLAALSPVLNCIMILSALYFAVYLVFWIVLLMMWNKTPNPEEEQEMDRLSIVRVFLECRAREAVRFCPILCILFLTTLLRAVQVSHGGVGQPTGWILMLVVSATCCTILLTFVRIDTAFRRVPTFVTSLCVFLQYICLIALYGSAIGLVYALFVMTPADTTIG